MGKISEIFNFDNIGGKIKNVAKWSCWMTILLIWIAAPIAFIALVIDDWTAHLSWIPFVGAIIGPVFVWIGSWAMYAFGEFVEDIHAIRNKEGSTTEEKIKREAEEKAKQKEETTRNSPTRKAQEYINHGIAPEYVGNGYTCPVCKMSMDALIPCEKCGYIPPQND